MSYSVYSIVLVLYIYLVVIKHTVLNTNKIDPTQEEKPDNFHSLPDSRPGCTWNPRYIHNNCKCWVVDKSCRITTAKVFISLNIARIECAWVAFTARPPSLCRFVTGSWFITHSFNRYTPWRNCRLINRPQTPVDVIHIDLNRQHLETRQQLSSFCN